MRTFSFLTFLGMLLFSTTLFAQQTPEQKVGQTLDPDYARRLADSDLINSGVMSFDSRYEGVKGHPLLHDKWAVARILFNDKPDTLYTGAALNLVDHKLMVLLKSGHAQEVAIETVASVHFDEGPLFISINRAFTDGKKQLGFYELLYDGTYQLLKHHRKYMQKADYQGAYATGKKYDEFKIDIDYYLSKDRKRYELIKLKAKNLEKALQALGENKKQAIKKTSLNLTTEAGVIQFLKEN